MSAKRSAPATKADVRALQTASTAQIAKLATKAELAELAAKMATKAELAKLATKAELAKLATKSQLRAIGVLMEKIDSKIDAVRERQTMRGELGDNRVPEPQASQRLGNVEDVVRQHSREIGAIQKRLGISR
jgi:hypothetical protein